MKCIDCNKTIKQLGSYNPSEGWEKCLDCFKIEVEERKKKIEPTVIHQIKKSGIGGGIDNDRLEADRVFEKAQQTAEHYGDKSKQAVNQNSVNDKIREAHKQARKAIQFKVKDNQKRGRTYNDGKFY